MKCTLQKLASTWLVSDPLKAPSELKSTQFGRLILSGLVVCSAAAPCSIAGRSGGTHAQRKYRGNTDIPSRRFLFDIGY